MNPLGASLFVVLLCAAAPDGGEQPARGAETVQAKIIPELGQRLEGMLAEQIKVRDATVQLGKTIAANDGRSGRGEHQAGQILRDQQQEICRSAKSAITLLENERAVVAFVEVFQQVHNDMRAVEARLGKTDAGAATIDLQNEIIGTLEEMIEALKPR
jgi:hypothetical protein